MELNMPVAYKVLDRGRSFHGGTGRWQKGRWRSVRGPLVPCRNGLHYCRPEHLVHWLGPEIWLFEDGSPDETIDAGDKMVTRRGRVVERVTAWDDRAARLFAADCAERVLPLFERERPNDDRPRKAIAAARAFANGEIDAAARAAAGEAAEDAAWDAERGAAWYAAWYAAWAATWAAARGAAWEAAEDAAWDAAKAAARAAARDVAEDAEREWQTSRLLDYLHGPCAMASNRPS